MLTKLQIINQTVRYYKKYARCNKPGTNGGSICVYYHEDEEGYSCCAVGRCLKNPKLFDGNSYGVSEFNCEFDLNAQLKPDYRGHEIEFWEEIQELHDSDCYWKNNELTTIGKKYVEDLKLRWT